MEVDITEFRVHQCQLLDAHALTYIPLPTLVYTIGPTRKCTFHSSCQLTIFTWKSPLLSIVAKYNDMPPTPSPPQNVPNFFFSFLFFWCMCWSLGPSYTTPFMVLNVTCVIVSLHDTWCSSAHTNILARVYSTMLWDVCLCYTTVYKLTKCTQMTHDISMLNNILFLHIKI